MEEEKQLGFKHWFSRTIMLAIIIFLGVYWIDQNTNWDIFIHAIIAATIALFLGFLHEALHYYKAVKFGYKPKWFRTKVRICFEVNLTGSKAKQLKERRIIGIFPYIFVIPIAIVVLVAGIYLDHLGITIGGVATLLMHGITFWKEGK